MNSGFFGRENMRDLWISAKIVGAILGSILFGLIAFVLFKSLLLSVISAPCVCAALIATFFGPASHRASWSYSLGSVSAIALIVAGLMRVELSTYHSFYLGIMSFIQGLLCVAVIALLLIGAIMSLRGSSPVTSSDVAESVEPTLDGSRDWDEGSEYAYGVDPERVEELIDLLNEDEVDPDEVEYLIDDGAKNGCISFRYKKQGERARRRNVIVKIVDGDCLGCIDLTDEGYKTFKFARMSDVRKAKR